MSEQAKEKGTRAIHRLWIFLASLSLALGTIVGVASPAQATTVNYYLPYTAGFTAIMTQGPGGSTSHTGTNAHAYDFDLNGGAVRASAPGTIISKVANETSQTGPGSSGNYVVLKHADNTCTSYVHMAHGSVTTKNVGDTVAQAEQIGNEGNTGYTLPVGGGHHLHFQRDNCSWNSMSVDFVENNWTSQNNGAAPPEENTSADFNRDGKSDIAWLTSSGTVNSLLSTGTSFTTSGLAAGYANPTWAGVGNFNADDRGDIALYQASNQTLYLLKGDSSGAWAAGPVLTNLAEPAWAGVGDFNRDGLDDLAWYTSQNGGTITALLSSGTSFTSSVIATGYAIPTWAGTGDFNGDGRGDIAWYQESNQTLYLLKANNEGQWSAGAVVTGLSKPKWAGTGDFTHDGKTDIAWYRSSGGTITILVATATSFNSSALVTGYAIPTWAGTGDYNGDGRDDIAWYQSNQTLYLLKANSTGAWAAGPVMTGLAPPIWAGNGSPPIS